MATVDRKREVTLIRSHCILGTNQVFSESFPSHTGPVLVLLPRNSCGVSEFGLGRSLPATEKCIDVCWAFKVSFTSYQTPQGNGGWNKRSQVVIPTSYHLVWLLPALTAHTVDPAIFPQVFLTLGTVSIHT